MSLLDRNLFHDHVVNEFELLHPFLANPASRAGSGRDRRGANLVNLTDCS
jgi:hypothetical protein